MHHLEIKHLRMICAIADFGSLTRAAQKLFLSQSALSQQLKDIENKLRVDLFSRARRKMILTPTGQKLLRTARRIVDELDEAEMEIARSAAGDSGELKVGMHCIFCYKWLPAVMEIFQKQYPNVSLEIGGSIDPIGELESQKFDLIITAAFEQSDQLEYVPLFKDQMVCIMCENHPLARESHIGFDDFAGVNLISHAEKEKNRFYQMILKPRGIEPGRFMAVGQPSAMIQMVAAGFGISIFPRWAVQSALEEKKIAARPITRTGMPLTWMAAVSKSSRPPAGFEAFINAVGRIHLTADH